MRFSIRFDGPGFGKCGPERNESRGRLRFCQRPCLALRSLLIPKTRSDFFLSDSEPIPIFILSFFFFFRILHLCTLPPFILFRISLYIPPIIVLLRVRPGANVGSGPSAELKPRVEKPKGLTVAESPMLSTKRRSAMRSSSVGGVQTSEQAELDEAAAKQFRARPMPNYSKMSSQVY